MGRTGYVPVSLQCGDYTAQGTRNPSIAGSDLMKKFTNRAYDGKTAKTVNTTDMKMITETFAKMNGKPVIVAL